MGRRVLSIFLFSFLFLPYSAAAVSVEETELAARLVEDSSALLEQLLGPGRAKVLITVEGERSETKTSTDIQTPIDKPGQNATSEQEGVVGAPGFAQQSTTRMERDAMPGYAPYYVPSELMDKSYRYVQEKNNTIFQRDQQESRRSNFQVNKINVSLLVDTAIPQTQAEAVRKVLADMLRLNVLRGDSIVLVRASLTPMWKRLLLSPDIFKTALSHSMIVVGLLATGLVLGVLFVWGMRTLAQALLHRQQMPQQAPEMPPAAEPEMLGAEGPPTLDTTEAAATPTLALEAQERFGFLAGHPAQEVAQILEGEPPEDLALLFSWLADRQTELGTLLFSNMSPQVQLEVSKAMVRLRQADPERIDILEGHLRTQVETRLKGTDKLGLILSRLGPQEREIILGDLSRVDAQASQEVQNSLVTFEDLAAMKVEDLRKLAFLLPIQVWATALRGADQEFAERVTSLFPAGMRSTFQESFELAQPKEKVLEARSKILSQALALADQGQLNIKAARTTEVI